MFSTNNHSAWLNNWPSSYKRHHMLWRPHYYLCVRRVLTFWFRSLCDLMWSSIICMEMTEQWVQVQLHTKQNNLETTWTSNQLSKNVYSSEQTKHVCDGLCVCDGFYCCLSEKDLEENKWVFVFNTTKQHTSTHMQRQTQTDTHMQMCRCTQTHTHTDAQTDRHTYPWCSRGCLSLLGQLRVNRWTNVWCTGN